MPICGIDTGLVNIPVGKFYPTDSVFVNAKKDNNSNNDINLKNVIFTLNMRLQKTSFFGIIYSILN